MVQQGGVAFQQLFPLKILRRLSSMASAGIESWELNAERYVPLLADMIKEAEFTQNAPPDLNPEESRIGDLVEAYLAPVLTANGGPVSIERVEYTDKRNNVILTYPGTSDKTITFIGSHMDVVPANADEWQRNPFELVVEGDNLYGRGTTDCLGHVALLSDLFMQLGEKKPELVPSIVAVFICNEEDGTVPDIGVDKLNAEGKLSHLKNGPCYWVDAADQQPCIGSGGCLPWSLKVIGYKGHSGMPQNAVNPILLAHEATTALMKKFHEEYPAHPSEAEYGYQIPSTMKPTKFMVPSGGLNQIPSFATIQGDIRLTPFYSVPDVIASVEGYVAELNANIDSLPAHVPGSSYIHPTGARGTLELSWLGEPMRGVAVDITSDGYKALADATAEVLGECKPEALTGSLPLVAELKDSGFDLVICGYGVEEVYHGVDEYTTLQGMKNGFSIFCKLINSLNKE